MKIISLGYDPFFYKLLVEHGFKHPSKCAREVCFPFDLTITLYDDLCQILENNFKEYLNPDNLIELEQLKRVEHKLYPGVKFKYQPKKQLIKKFHKRVRNFQKTIQSNDVFFVIHCNNYPTRLIEILNQHVNRYQLLVINISKTKIEPELDNKHVYIENINADYSYHQIMQPNLGSMELIQQVVGIFHKYFEQVKIDLDLNHQLEHIYGQHRSGWLYALDGLAKYQTSETAVYLDSFIERTFMWSEGNRHTYSWVGFIHNPPHIPNNLFDHRQDIQYLLQNPDFQASLPYCKGIFTLSHHHKKLLKSYPEFQNITIDNIYHPIEDVEWHFDYQRYLSNPKKKVYQIGFWLRDIKAIFQLKTDHQKIILPYNERMMKLLKRPENKKELTEADYQSVRRIPYLDNHNYDSIFIDGVVFLKLYDATANNVIVECLIRNTPVLVNKLPSVVEYLGEDYPWYYGDLDEAKVLIDDIEKVKETHLYLLKRDKKFVKRQTFVKSILQSRIYRSLQQSKYDSVASM